jgi:hypothetical protein
MHDGYFLPPLVEKTAENFQIQEVAADKAYLSKKNLRMVDALGGTPYIPFTSRNVEPKDDSIWAKMYYRFMYQREEFMEHYHKRSSMRRPSPSSRRGGCNFLGEPNATRALAHASIRTLAGPASMRPGA